MADEKKKTANYRLHIAGSDMLGKKRLPLA